MRKLLPLLLLLLSGCVTNPNGGTELTDGGRAALKEVAAIGVSRWARESDNIQRVERVRALLVELQGLPDITTVDGLKGLVLARIETNVSDPYDKKDLTHLVNILAPLLKDYVGAGQLEPKAVVMVREWLSYLADELKTPVGT